MKYRVRPLRKARQDVDGIVTWLVEERRTQQGAAAWLRAYQEAAASLVTFPERHSHAPENKHVELEVRQFLFKTKRGRTYRGIYTIDGDEVLILRVRGPGQAAVQPSDLIDG